MTRRRWLIRTGLMYDTLTVTVDADSPQTAIPRVSLSKCVWNNDD